MAFPKILTLIYLFVYSFLYLYVGVEREPCCVAPGWAGMYDVAQANFKLTTIFLLQSSEGSDYSDVPPCLA